MIEVNLEEHVLINIKLVDEEAKAFISELKKLSSENKGIGSKYNILAKIYQELTTK